MTSFSYPSPFPTSLSHLPWGREHTEQAGAKPGQPLEKLSCLDVSQWHEFSTKELSEDTWGSGGGVRSPWLHWQLHGFTLSRAEQGRIFSSCFLWASLAQVDLLDTKVMNHSSFKAQRLGKQECKLDSIIRTNWKHIWISFLDYFTSSSI